MTKPQVGVSCSSNLRVSVQPPERPQGRREIPAQYTDVFLAGELGKKFGRKWRLVCRTPAQALRLIGLARPDFKKHMIESAKAGLGFHVICDRRSRTEAQLALPAGKRLIISHAVAGAKGAMGSVLEIIAGAVLIVASVFQPEIAAYGWTWFTPGIAAATGAVGMSLVLAGITQLLSPQASSSSYYFNGASNTITQGQPVPVVYGEMLVGGLPIYSAMSAVNTSAAAAETGLIVDNPS